MSGSWFVPVRGVVQLSAEISSAAADRVVRAVESRGAFNIDRSTDSVAGVTTVQFVMQHDNFRRMEQQFCNKQFFPNIVQNVQLVIDSRYAMLAFSGFAARGQVLRLRRRLTDARANIVREQISAFPLVFPAVNDPMALRAAIRVETGPDGKPSLAEFQYVSGSMLLEMPSNSLRALMERIAMNAIPSPGDPNADSPPRWFKNLHPRLSELPRVVCWMQVGDVESLAIEAEKDSSGSLLSLHQQLAPLVDLIQTDAQRVPEMGNEIRPWRCVIRFALKHGGTPNRVLPAVHETVRKWLRKMQRNGRILRASWSEIETPSS